LPDIRDGHDIARRLNLPAPVVAKVLQLLTEQGLCMIKDGKLDYGAAHIYIDRDSPHAHKHQRNWRIRAMHIMEQGRDENMFFTSPMSLSREVFEEVRRLLPNVIQEISKKAGPSPSEKVACLNIDWFDYAPAEEI
ncbi:MAG: DUF4423 domain-containing protein, partial [Bdellovibrionaceae bacterium]|nr:DUF4423 domain-containing protein [Pseudobdellovibrionaceae bacterium]